MKLIRLAQDKDKCRAVTNMQMNIHKSLFHINSKLMNY
jgi:hypothetical protein